MSPLHFRRTLLVMALAVAAALGVATPAAAQFETPNRRFHDETSFPLDGRHRDLPCQSCHQDGVYQGTPNQCFDCHWVKRQDDRFRLQLGSECAQCHRSTAWSDTRWEHEAMTGMSLGGAHRLLSCQSCHMNDSFQMAQTDCVSCHLADYQATQAPSHLAAGFPTDCEACHRAGDTTFTQARFDHAAAFPLVGVHAQQLCATCHTGGVYAGTPSACVGCHLDDYQRTSMPSHIMAGFSTSCQDCHSPTAPSFSSGSQGFDHSAVFPLVGVHAQQLCASCHTGGVYAGTPRDCAGCHLQLYNATTSPSHSAAGFPTTCESCHRATDSLWTQGRFTHLFPITSGPHRTECVTCHQGGNFQAFTCLVCHKHSRSEMDDKHRNRPGYLYDSLACYSCHPNGKH